MGGKRKRKQCLGVHTSNWHIKTTPAQLDRIPVTVTWYRASIGLPLLAPYTEDNQIPL